MSSMELENISSADQLARAPGESSRRPRPLKGITSTIVQHVEGTSSANDGIQRWPKKQSSWEEIWVGMRERTSNGMQFVGTNEFLHSRMVANAVDASQSS